MSSFDSNGDSHKLRAWVDRHLQLSSGECAEVATERLPFSFQYGALVSVKYLARLPVETKTSVQESKKQTIKTWKDKRSGLEIRYEAVEYTDYPVVEWTVYFRNIGDSLTDVIQNIQGLDTLFLKDADGDFVLNGHKGDSCDTESYEPYSNIMGESFEKRFAPGNGKSSGGADGWPYYNVQMPGGGVIVAIGWPGQWTSTFTRTGEDGLHIRVGQAQTHLRLQPGEEIRTPLIAMLFWQGDNIVNSQNVWRRWFWNHNSPRPQGIPPVPLTSIQLGNSERGLWEETDKFMAAGIRPNIGWRDANWYPTDGGPFKDNMSWLNTGTWEPDPVKYPDGFRAYSDWARDRGIQFMLWFEPERVGDPESYLAKHHPEWLLEGPESCGPILNLGDPQAWNWITNHVDAMIRKEGIDWYREDMNGPGPLPAWTNNDGPDRVGMTENLYVQGHLAFWDELVRRNPELRIDTCASGGRRNDLETMRRAVPLLRSDYQFPEDRFPDLNQSDVREANQGHTYGLASWFPYYGSGAYVTDEYGVRSFYMPAFGVIPQAGWEQDKQETQAVRRAYDENVRVAPFMLGDYYPLTPYSLSQMAWIAWQFDRPESGDGIIQAFRRRMCVEESLFVRLSGLDPAAYYDVVTVEGNDLLHERGSVLMERGMAVNIPDAPGAAILLYRVNNA
ncbi:alpha-galactosidase [Paenibacillus nasutitermitis]|uniref:Alpha-galactosidase n=1 Tax=Paenibacillus nasutitermitis TaxID=1652958 RepID=A0A917DYU4_9BACL|nr:alpha-galactosidase [Paenibacillus nasutitermitis]GGD79909.1 hypothetical protein GCM10010911_42520 [Paenibacillus nasutitermitis]